MEPVEESRFTLFKDGEVTEAYTTEEICDAIRARIYKAENDAKYALNEMNKMRNEKWKDEELQKMRAQVETMKADLYRSFQISLEERNAINDWQEKHRKNRHNNNAYINFTYSFLPTSIGTIGICICPICSELAERTAEEIVNRKDFSSKKEYKLKLNTKKKKLEEKYDSSFLFRDLS